MALDIAQEEQGAVRILGLRGRLDTDTSADLELAVEGALFGAFGTAGQRCTSTSRLVVHRSIADEH